MRMHTRSLCTLLLSSALSVPPLAAAQERSPDPLTPDRVGRMTLRELMDEEVVFAAARYEQNPSEAATAVTIITADEIQQFGYRTIQDVLSAVRGFYTTFDRNYSYVGIRGISPPGDYNARVLLQIDGHRANENTYDGVYIGTDSLIDLALVDRVEIVHGPGSSLYGSNAVFAVVNFVTRSGADASARQVEGDIGSLGTVASRFRYGIRSSSGVDVLVSAARYKSDGHPTLFFPELADTTASGGVTTGTDGDEYQRLFGKLSRGAWALQGAYADRRKVIPTGSFQTVFDDPRSQTTDRRAFGSLAYRSPAGRAVALRGRVALDRYSYEGLYVTDYGQDGVPDILINHDLARGTWLTTELQATRVVARRHQLVGGFEYRDNDQSIGNFDREIYTDIHVRTRVLGLFAQDEWRLHKRLALVLGVRHDRYPWFGGATNPRLSAVITPSPSTTVKVTHGRAFRPPNVSERTEELQPAEGAGTARIRPETMIATEAVVERRFDRLLGGEAWFSVSAFRDDLRDMIGTMVEDGWSRAANIGSAHTAGVELEARARWANDIVARGSLALNHVGDGDERDLANAPRRLGSLRVHVPLRGERLGLGVQATFVGTRLSANSAPVPGATTTDGTLVWKAIGRRLTVSANLRNLFNAAVYAPTSSGFVQNQLRLDGRTFYLNTAWRF